MVSGLTLRQAAALTYGLLWLVGCSGTPSGYSLPPPAPPPMAGAVAEAAGTFEPGDTLELFVKEDATLGGSYVVRDGGYIVIPRAGRIPVEGRDRSGAETAIKEHLQKTQLTEATVLVERTSARKTQAAALGGPPGIPKLMIYITGAVPRAGVHYVPVPPGGNLGVYEALLITGGMGKFAQENQVELFRADESGRRQRAVVDLKLIREGKAEDPSLGNGDIVNVPEKVFGF